LGLSQALLKLFSGKFDLCAEFKRLYVYGSTFDPTYPEQLIQQDMNDDRPPLHITFNYVGTEAELN